MSIEAMKLALDALEWNLPVIEDYGDKEQLNRQHSAITALRQAIEQAQKQEPAIFLKEWSDWRDMVVANIMRHGSIDKHLARQLANHFQGMIPQQKQEPVAFRTESRITKAVGYWSDRVPDYIDANSWEITPLYTKEQL